MNLTSPEIPGILYETTKWAHHVDRFANIGVTNILANECLLVRLESENITETIAFATNLDCLPFYWSRRDLSSQNGSSYIVKSIDSFRDLPYPRTASHSIFYEDGAVARIVEYSLSLHEFVPY